MRFLLNSQLVEELPDAPDQTLLSFLRNKLGLSGTKEGCASGDCGACTVLVGTRDGEYLSVNACIAPAAIVAGHHVVTVEGLALDGTPHPAQRWLVEEHGSQCGYCTPGFVMSLAGLHEEIAAEFDDNEATAAAQDAGTVRDRVCAAIGGNLCRCTGYRPIVAAGSGMVEEVKSGPDRLRLVDLVAPDRRASWPSDESAELVAGYFRPDNEAQLKNLMRRLPDAMLIAGGTDLMLEHTQQYSDFGALIDLSAVPELSGCTSQSGSWRIGAAATLTSIEAALTGRLAELFAQLLHRFASLQIRNRATIGGNLGTASPIGDLAPLLQALNASLVIAAADHDDRIVPIDEFFVGYRKTVCQPGEYLKAIEIPEPGDEQFVTVAKNTKRFEDDISTVFVACAFTLSASREVVDARIAFGGMDAVPRRSVSLETLVCSSPNVVFEQIHERISADFSPISDVRASARYRLHIAAALVEGALDSAREAEGIAQ